ncbi:MAG: hypothetical protein K0B85_01330 [Coriobacteriia bacterium]|nr:hypothetical protein [Coriobacteriia bacterium]
MRVLRTVVLGLVVVATLALAACGPEGLVSRLNLLGQTRFATEERVYGLEEVLYTAAEVEISLVRVRPVGVIDDEDARIVSAVDDLMLVDADGEGVPPSSVVADPTAHEGGFVVLRFDVSGHPAPWTLEWPDNKPYTIE